MTADLSCTLVWAVLVFGVDLVLTILKTMALSDGSKVLLEPIVVMTPMNIIGEIAQPVSMAFRHFGNVAGGGVITSILYLALSLLSNAVLGLIAANGVLIPIVLTVVGVGLIVWSKKKTHKKWSMILGIVSSVLGVFGLLQAMGVLEGVPVLSFGIPAVLSCYFDIFSGFVQAYVFSLLTMVYIGNACPPPEETGAVQ